MKTSRLAELIDQIESFRFCGPSDDLDEQTAVLYAFRHIVIAFRRAARGVHDTNLQQEMLSIKDPDDLYEAYDVHSQITVMLEDLRDYIESSNYKELTIMSEIDVFISHSSEDQEFVKRLITFIRSALNLPSDKIRCTSVDGFRLPAGISTNEALKKEIHHSKAFIAVITPQSIQSTYVLFELGARWGSEKPMIPLLACGASSEHLQGPLRAINALDASQSAQLHQFIEELAGLLGIEHDRPAAFEKCIKEVVAASGTK